MTVDDRELDGRLRATLRAWAEEAPNTGAAWVGDGGAPRKARRWSVRVVPIAIAAAVLVAALVVAGSPDEESLVVVGRDDLVVEEARVGSALGVRVMAPGDDAVYVASENDRRLYRLDLETNSVLDGPALAVPDGVVALGDDVFAIVDDPPRLARLDPSTLEVVESVAVVGQPSGFVGVDGLLWVRDDDGTVRLVDPDTLDSAGNLESPLPPGFQADGHAGLWRTELGTGFVRRIDPHSGAVLAAVDVGGEARAIAVDGDDVWVADVANDRVVRLDAARATVTASVDVGRFPHSLAVHDDRLWVGNFEDGTITVIDTASNAVVTTVPIGVRLGTILYLDGVLLVSVHQEGIVRRVDPARLESISLQPVNERELDVDVGGRSIFVRCMGAAHDGRPTVVLEAGIGQWSEHELFVQYGLQSTHRVCAYDRAGLGRSDPGPEPRTARRIVDDLHRALEKAGIAGPYLLVGHNAGGLYTRLYAVEHADDVAGLVQVDAFTTTFFDDLRPLLDDEARAAFDDQQLDPELAGLAETYEQVDAAGDLDDLPLIVVAGETSLSDLGDDISDLWQRHQRSLLELSTDSELVVAEGRTATSPTDAPEVVVDAVRRLSLM